MKILLHAINYAPELTGIGKYLGEQAVWLAGQGHEVRVVTAPPYYPEWFVSGEFQGVRYKVEHRNGVKVYRCPLYVPATPSGLKRIVHLLSFAVSSFPVMLRQIFWRPDVVMVVEPPLFCAPAAWLTARLSGAKCWLHIQDYEVDAAFGLGLVRGEWLRRLVLACERWLYRRFDRVSSISGNMLKRLGGKGVASDKQYLFPNWVDITQIIPLQGDNPLRLELGIPPEKSIALYSGNMGDKQGLEIIPATARALADRDDLLFVMCGRGGAYERLRAAAGDCDNILWLPLQPLERLNELLNMADVHLLPQRADAADLVMPSKLTGMLSSGKPVLATAFEGTEVWEVVQGRGLVVPPDDVAAFCAALERLLDNEPLRHEMGGNARHYAEAYLCNDAILAGFEAQIQELVLRGKK